MEEDVLAVFYQSRGSLLYGAIQFFKHTPGSGPVSAHESSAPFVVSETLAPGEVVVHGSVNYLIQDIQRLITGINKKVDELHAALSHEPPSVAQGERARLASIPESGPEHRLYFEFTRDLAGTLILLSTQARNLFDLFPRLDRRIPLTDASGKHTGDIKLSNLFDHFVHNRYLFLNGEHVSDLFPGNPRPRAPISRVFMGYRFNWIAYVEAIDRATREVKLKDITGLLRGRLKQLSLKSPYSDIVFLIQNLESFSRLFGTKVPDERYQGMLGLLFNDDAKGHLDALKLEPEVREVRLITAFNTPSIKIHERLNEKKFKVHVRCRFTILDSNGQALHEDHDFRTLTKEVGYEALLGHVAHAFGDDPLLGSDP
ncbi:MAG: hypothetical protein OXG04_21825 [Acidobacteria bacterium]|nr:hypothetical protein [Acidobacteriota bacterium]